jgi:hypothetical protein
MMLCGMRRFTQTPPCQVPLPSSRLRQAAIHRRLMHWTSGTGRCRRDQGTCARFPPARHGEVAPLNHGRYNDRTTTDPQFA